MNPAARDQYLNARPQDQRQGERLPDSAIVGKGVLPRSVPAGCGRRGGCSAYDRCADRVVGQGNDALRVIGKPFDVEQSGDERDQKDEKPGEQSASFDLRTLEGSREGRHETSAFDGTVSLPNAEDGKLVARYDVVVIGSGSAGTAAALRCREAGRSVAVVESRELGGTCMLRGCDPKKVLVEAASVRDAVGRYAERGILTAAALDWGKLMRFKRTFTDPAPALRRRAYEDAGIVTLHGAARFCGERTLDVDGASIEAQNIVIATGARSAHVAPGDEHLLTSEDFLNLDALPPSIVFVGGGYIAFEFAHVAVRAGSRVTVLNSGPNVLAGFDAVLTDRLSSFSQQLGITIERNTRAERVERTASGVAVHGRHNGESVVYRAAAGVLAAGRVPNLDAVALERAGVDFGKHGVKVNEHLQSVSNPHVYAAGDCADDGGKPLTPVAGAQGAIVGHNIVSDTKRSFDAAGLASIVYTIPALATVGLSEAQARERGIDLDVREGGTSEWFSTRSTASDVGYYRCFIDRAHGAVVGASIFGAHAQEQINVLALAIRASVPVSTLQETLFGYPTGSSDIEYFTGG